MKKVKVVVLFGGPSSEHEVSVNSAENVIKNLNDKKFEIIKIKIALDGTWVDEVTNQIFSEKEGVDFLKRNNIDLIFLVLHGEYGEDGTVQKLLEEAGLNFTGSDSIASALAMDKVLSARAFERVGLKTPECFSVSKDRWLKEGRESIEGTISRFGLPVVVKPVDRGSSVGTSIVHENEKIAEAIDQAFTISSSVMIQKFIKGREFTCGVIEEEKGKVAALMPTEIIPNKKYKFFDYDAKYVTGASLEVTPPNDLSEKIIKEIQRLSILAHEALGCSHISRADFILEDNILYILEVNTIPGMTQNSLLPKGARAIGMDFPRLLETIIRVALQ